MNILKYLYTGLISPYLLIRDYIDKCTKDVSVYKIIYIINGKKEIDYLSINENIINNFLITENKQLISIKTNKLIKYRYRYLNKKQISDKELVYFLVNINKYLNIGNNIINSLSLVIKTCKYKNLERILRIVRYDLMCGNDLATSLSMQKNSFPEILINTLKDNSTNDINHLKDLEEYYKTLYINKSNTFKLNIYKIFIVPYVLMIIMFILGYIIPRFYSLYNKLLDTDLLFLKKFIKFSKLDNIAYILFIIISLVYLIFILLNHIKNIKIKLEYISMKFMKSITYNELIIFFKTLNLIIKYNIIDLNDSNNNIYFNNVLKNIHKTYKSDKVISHVLKKYKYIPNEAIEMIRSGEKFDSLLLQVNNVSNYYQNKLDKNKKITMSIIGPLIIILSTLLFGSIIIILLFHCLLIIK